jgi:transposase
MTRILAVDLGKFKSVACALNKESGKYGFVTVPTEPVAIYNFLSEQRPDRVVIEVGYQAGWIADLVGAMGIEIQVANPNHDAWRWKSIKRKTDRDDALRLAQMSQMGTLPTVHMPEFKIRQWRSFIAYRHTLVSRRTAIKNSIRAIMDQQGISWPSGRAGWRKKTLADLQPHLLDVEQAEIEALWKAQLSLEYEALQQIELLIQKVEAKLEQIARADQRVAQLQTIPGVGPRLAEIVVAIIDNPRRFKNAKQVGSYAGLVPKQYESGTMSRQGRITGRGNVLLRAMLVEVGWLMRRYNQWFDGIFARVCRGAKNRKKIAVVAVARRILICCWAMRRDGTTWRAVPAQP